MNVPSYPEAVEFAAAYLEKRGISSAREDMLKRLRFVFAVRTGYAFLDNEGNRAPKYEDDGRSFDELLEALDLPPDDASENRYRFVFTGENIETLDRLIEMSRQSSIAFNALLDVAASMARNGIPYQSNMRSFVADYLNGTIKRTARTGRIKAETLWRDLLIIGAVTELTELGMPATRNDVSPSVSACDAVAEALRRIKMAPGSFQSVKRIWHGSERVLRYF